MVEIVTNYRRFGKPANPHKGGLYAIVCFIFSRLPVNYHVGKNTTIVASQSVSVNLSVTKLASISVAVTVKP